MHAFSNFLLRKLSFRQLLNLKLQWISILRKFQTAIFLYCCSHGHMVGHAGNAICIAHTDVIDGDPTPLPWKVCRGPPTSKYLEYVGNYVQPEGKIITNEIILVWSNLCIKQLLTGNTESLWSQRAVTLPSKCHLK